MNSFTNFNDFYTIEKGGHYFAETKPNECTDIINIILDNKPEGEITHRGNLCVAIAQVKFNDKDTQANIKKVSLKRFHFFHNTSQFQLYV